MVVAGIMLKSNVARIVTLTGNRKSHKIIASKVNKLEIAKNPSQDEVEAFVMAFKAFCSDNAVDKIVINRRATSGQGAAGAGTFILEGVLLATSSVPIVFAHNATILATQRKDAELKIDRPATADLGYAFDLAFEGLT